MFVLGETDWPFRELDMLLHGDSAWCFRSVYPKAVDSAWSSTGSEVLDEFYTLSTGLSLDMDRSRNWSNLPTDLWVSIGFKLDTAADRIRFRAVSKLFRSCLPYHQPPWLMLSEFPDDSDDDSAEDDDDDPPPPRRRFVVVGEENYYKWDLPQAHLARSIGSTNYWVITVKRDTIVRLLNPFTKVEIDLPSHLTFDIGDPRYQIKPIPPEDIHRRNSFLRKAIICPGTDLLVIAVQNYGILAMAKPGDSSWTTIKCESKYHTGVRDIVVYNGLLYAITFSGLLLSCEFLSTSSNPPQLSVVQQFDLFKPHYDHQLLYLVEWCQQLLLVVKSVNMFGLDDFSRPKTIPFYKTEKFQVYKFDFTIKNWTEIKSLGEYSLFLGFNTSVSVLASDYFGSVKKNCIYFTDDFHFGYCGTGTPGGYDMGVFNLDDNSITPHFQGKSTCCYSPPIWIVPN